MPPTAFQFVSKADPLQPTLRVALANPKSPREAFKGSHRNEVDIEASAIARDVTREVMRGIAKDFGTNVAGATQ